MANFIVDLITWYKRNSGIIKIILLVSTLSICALISLISFGILIFVVIHNFVPLFQLLLGCVSVFALVMLGYIGVGLIIFLFGLIVLKISILGFNYIKHYISKVNKDYHDRINDINNNQGDS